MSSAARHHELLMKIRPWKGSVSKGAQVDFLGIKTRTSFFTGLKPFELEGFSAPPLPEFDESYFEWVDLLEAVKAARGDFTMMELGAGYGRWLVRAAFAATHFGDFRCKFIGVEAEPSHFEWMNYHFRDNGLDPEKHTLIQGAVSGRDGEARFLVGSPDEWYGQRIALLEDFGKVAIQRIKALPARSSRSSCAETEGESFRYGIEKVKTVSLNTLLRDVNRADLIDLDVQGAELEVLKSAKSALERKAARVHVGTHNGKVESGLRSLFSEMGWTKVFDFPCGGASETPWGRVAFVDGVQSWANPDLTFR